MNPRRASIELLGRCLGFHLDPGELAALRARLLSSPAVWDEVTDFAASEGLVHALERSLRAKGLLPSQFLPPAARQSAPDRKLAAAAVALAERRSTLAGHLREIIGRLNSRGIEPIVIKGAQSLLNGEPDWRYLRDFDLLVTGRPNEAQSELLAMGFEVPEAEQQRSRRHHLPPLVREDFPGFIEIHRRAGNQYVRALLPTEELVAASVSNPDGGLRYGLLPPPHHVLYGLIHHHLGHAGDARGTISLKGLYEFAWDLNRMGGSDRAALKARADRHPRISAALDTWIASAVALYGLPIEAPLAVRDDATRTWQRTLARIDQPRPWYKYPGYVDEIRMGLAESRINAAPLGASLPGRAWTRLRVLRSFLPRFTK
jgi:hypothetical protein